MLFQKFIKEKQTISTIAFIGVFMMLLTSCNMTGENSYIGNKNTNISNISKININYQAQPTLYARQAIPKFAGLSYINLLQVYNQGNNILLSAKAKLPVGSKYIHNAQNLYTYNIYAKKLTKLTTEDGKNLLACNIFHRRGAAISEDGKYVYFVAPDTEVSAVYPSGAGFNIAQYDMATKKITPLLINEAQFNNIKYKNPSGKLTPISDIWKHLVHSLPYIHGTSPSQRLAMAVSPDGKTLYFAAWAYSIPSQQDDVGVYALDLSRPTHSIHLLGYSSVNIKNTHFFYYSGVWLTVSPHGSFIVLSSDNANYPTLNTNENGFIVLPAYTANINLNKAPYLFQGNNPSGIYYRFLGFDPKDSQKFFVSLINDNNNTISIEQGRVGSSQLKPLVGNQKQIMSINIPQTNGQAALFSNPTTQQFSLFDFNNPKQIIPLRNFPSLSKMIVSKNNSNIRYQMIDGRTVVFADKYGGISSNMYIYQYPLKKAKNV